MGVWSNKTTTVAAIAGMFVGFSITLFCLVVTRYFPVEGVTWFGMWANTNAVTGLPVVDVQAALLLPHEEAAAMIHSKVGWFGLNNISAAIFERVTGRSETDETGFRIWLVGMALIALPAFGNFLACGFSEAAAAGRASGRRVSGAGRPYQPTEAWLMLDPAHRPPAEIAQRAVGVTLFVARIAFWLQP